LTVRVGGSALWVRQLSLLAGESSSAVGELAVRAA
jgi:hypothetical protein